MTLGPLARSALAWLPADGSWRGGADRGVQQTLGHLLRRGLIERNARGGPTRSTVYRLTEAGLAAREGIESRRNSAAASDGGDRTAAAPSP